MFARAGERSCAEGSAVARARGSARVSICLCEGAIARGRGSARAGCCGRGRVAIDSAWRAA